MGIITNKIYICLPFEKEADKLDWNGLLTEEYNGKTYYKIPSGGSSSDVVKKITFETLKDNATVTLNIVSSSEQNWDFAYACELDGTSGYSNAKYKISGDNQSIACEYVVPNKGSHWIYIGYRKDSSGDRYNDCGYFSIDVINKEYVIRQPKEVYLASDKMNEITYGNKKVLESGFNNTISWETLTWNKSNNTYNYNSKGPISMRITAIDGATSGRTLTTSPSNIPFNNNQVNKVTFTNSESNSSNTYIYKIDLSNWDTSYITNMNSMFDSCEHLVFIDSSEFNTSNVIGMYSLFSGCSSLTSLDVSKWDTSKVTTMYSLFKDCNKLTSLDVSKWDTSKVTNMGFMFYGCNKLTSLDVSKWDTSKVTTMYGMFYGCNKLTSLDVSKWDTSKVTNMDFMFYGCNKLTSLDVSKWDTSKVTTMYCLFSRCSSLTELDLSKWDVSNVTNIRQIFYYCSSLTTLIAGHESETNVTALNGLKVDIDLSDCTKLNTESISAICDGLANLPSDNKKTITVSKTKENDIGVKIAMLNASIKNWNTVYE